MSTLNKFSADMIVDAMQKCFAGKTGISIYCSGGGIHNPLLMEDLQKQLTDHSFHTTDALGINPDAKEAVLFAILANECICGDSSTFIGPGMQAISMGKISFPS